VKEDFSKDVSIIMANVYEFTDCKNRALFMPFGCPFRARFVPGTRMKEGKKV
jgi:hypothetical protein